MWAAVFVLFKQNEEYLYTIINVFFMEVLFFLIFLINTNISVLSD